MTTSLLRSVSAYCRTLFPARHWGYQTKKVHPANEYPWFWKRINNSHNLLKSNIILAESWISNLFPVLTWSRFFYFSEKIPESLEKEVTYRHHHVGTQKKLVTVKMWNQYVDLGPCLPDEPQKNYSGRQVILVAPAFGSIWSQKTQGGARLI